MARLRNETAGQRNQFDLESKAVKAAIADKLVIAFEVFKCPR